MGQDLKPLDIRDISIIDALPNYDVKNRTILEIGCGKGRLSSHLAEMGYRVFATDIKECVTWIDTDNPTFSRADIFDLESMPVRGAESVICSQVLEHLAGYKKAVVHLLALTEIRLIITVPTKKAFSSPSHVNFWGDYPVDSIGFKDIREFHELCSPFAVSISKIRTKPEDKKNNKSLYLVIVDKRQNLY